MAHQQWDWSVSEEVFRHPAEKALSQATVRIGAHCDHCRLLLDRSRDQRRSCRALVPRAGDQVSLNSMPLKQLGLIGCVSAFSLVLRRGEDRHAVSLVQEWYRAQYWLDEERANMTIELLRHR